jgi:hypothetical protein
LLFGFALSPFFVAGGIRARRSSDGTVVAQLRSLSQALDQNILRALQYRGNIDERPSPH